MYKYQIRPTFYQIHHPTSKYHSIRIFFQISEVEFHQLFAARGVLPNIYGARLVFPNIGNGRL